MGKPTHRLRQQSPGDGCPEAEHECTRKADEEVIQLHLHGSETVSGPQLGLNPTYGLPSSPPAASQPAWRALESPVPYGSVAMTWAGPVANRTQSCVLPPLSRTKMRAISVGGGPGVPSSFMSR